MTGKIVRYPDPDKRSRNADAVHRDPGDSAIIIILPIIRVERYSFEMPARRAGKTEKLRQRMRVKARRRPT